MLCSFLLYTKVNQPYVYICPLSLTILYVQSYSCGLEIHGASFLGQQIPLLMVLIGAASFAAQHSRFGVGGADREEAGFSLSRGPCFFP